MDITRGNPGSVKAVLASVVLALAIYQLILAAIGYRKLPIIEAKPAFLTHRSSGDAIAVLFVLVALMCLGVFGIEDDYVAARADRGGARRRAGDQGRRGPHRHGRALLPVLGITLFTLIAISWFTVTPDFLAGED